MQTPRASSDSCDDANACTVADHCSSGVCVGGGPPDDSLGDFTTAFTSDASVSVHGVAAAADGGAFVLLSVAGPVPLVAHAGPGQPQSTAAPAGADAYVSLVRLRPDGTLQWVKPLITASGSGARATGWGGLTIHEGDLLTASFFAAGENLSVGSLLTRDVATNQVLGIVRLSADGDVLWKSYVEASFVEDGALGTRVTCTSRSGRAALVVAPRVTVYDQSDVHDLHLHDAVARITPIRALALGATVAVVALTATGQLAFSGRIDSDNDLSALGCAIDDSGRLAVTGVAEGVQLSSATFEGTHVTPANVSHVNNRTGWVAGFGSNQIPIFVTRLHSAL
ncbi:MAG: hypothetical protein JNJ59_00905, partial [Deltaproteobacteria bacterium]|nr:hypothetical protein [Deltaproteobacteria bacterium]